MDTAFGVLRVPPRSTKPRRTGLTVVNDRGLSLRQAEDLIEVHGGIVDYAKITDFVGLIAYYSADFVRQKTALFRKNGIGCLPGGIAFQIAALQDAAPQFFERTAELGFSAVEISEDSIPNQPPERRREWVRQAQELGLEVFTEIGKKVPDSPLSLDESVASIEADFALGVKKVVIEKSDLVLLKDTNPDLVQAIAERVGQDRLVFEGGPNEFPHLPKWLIETFGPEVNLENLEVHEAHRVEGMRRGLDRYVDYDFLRLEGGRVPV
ncbi:MAG: phosphosulfolactate synthase [Chloroflexi bacterium]|nr:phosphosulfolactate synthase [Chloroflexota bacterium]